jgi:peptide/nickel transport system substrate-binding protein
MADGTLSIKPMSNTQSKHDPAMDALLEKRARRSIRRRRTRSCSGYHDKVVDEALFVFVTHDVNP